jgi:sugar phosphate isomerase/epimerase
MKIACSTFSFDRAFRMSGMGIAGFMKACADLGLDAVELNDGYLLRDSIQPAKIKRTAVCLALDICALACETVVYVGDSAAVEAYRANLFRWLDVCDALGAPILRVNTAQPHNGMHEVPTHVCLEQVQSWALNAFRQVAAAARERGIILAVENHYGLTRTSADTLAFVETIGHDNVGVNVDTGNFWESPFDVRNVLAADKDVSQLTPFEDPYLGIERLAGHMVFSHCKVYGLTEDGTDDRVLDYGRIVRIYRDRGYRGYLSIENFTEENPCDIVARSAQMLRHHLSAVDDVGLSS